MKRHKTEYPGVFYREVKRIGGIGKEKVYYVLYKKGGKLIEAKAGRQHADDMTPAKANKKRNAFIEGREKTPQEKRIAEKAAREADNTIWTIDKLWELYCEQKSDLKSLKNDSYKYKSAILPDFGDKEPKDIAPLDVDRLRLKYQKQGKKAAAAKSLELLRRVINFGVKRNLVPPIDFTIEIPKLNNETTEDLTPKQVKKLVEVLEADEDQATAKVMLLILHTGMRPGELFKLKWEHIDFDRGFINIVDPKGGKDVPIPLNNKARKIFKSIKRQDDSEYVFPGRFKGTHLTRNNTSVTRIKKAAELPKDFRPMYGLRHVYASMLASSGKVDIYTLQRLLTHKSPAMTQRYAHLRDEALKKASDVAADLVSDMLDESSDDKKVANLEDHKQ